MSRIVVIAQFILLSCPAFAARIVYVDQNATGLVHNGSSWCSAFLDVQDALDAEIVGTEIRVADGRYVPDRGTGDRAAAFAMRNGVILSGGYAGCGASNPDARNVSVFETILSGDLLNNDVFFSDSAACSVAGGSWHTVLCDMVGNNAENSYHVVVSTNNDSTAILDGFTVSGGHANGVGFGPTPDSQEQGSGINIYFGTPLLTNCLIKDNRTDNHGAVNDHGGATLLNCEIRGNFATRWGGGLHNHVDIATTATDCQFIDNATAGTAGGGGGMFVKGNPVLTRCVFSGNVSAVNGGAMYATAESSPIPGGPVLIDSQFTDNVAISGAGLYAIRGASATVQGCMFSGNFAKATTTLPANGNGAAIYISGGILSVTDSSFQDNKFTRFGVVYITQTFQATVTDSEFLRNEGVGDLTLVDGSGPGVYVFASTADIARCTFADNSSATYAGAISCSKGGGGFGGTVTIRSCNFLRNFAAVRGGAIQNGFLNRLTIDDCLFEENHSIFQGGAISALHVNSPVAITNSVFRRNFTSGLGGAIYLFSSATMTMTNSLFEGNSVTASGGAMAIGSASAIISQCTFSGNSRGASNIGSTVALSSSQQAAPSTLTISNSILWDGAGWVANSDQSQLTVSSSDVLGGWQGTGNFSLTPQFVDVDAGDLRLAPGSPCKDAGSNSAIPAGLVTDLDGNPRVVFGIVDVGAYELQVNCGDGNCEPGENQCNCPADCGAPPSSEDPGLTCRDGMDNDCDGGADCADPDCASVCSIPAVSEWGVCCMLLLLLTAGSLAVRRQRAVVT